MSKKRGLSVEEKRSRMMDFFFEKKTFFTLKELEKQCQKEKGITSMSVKEILTSLVDDCMVDTEKIGTSVYFWSYPSKASQNRKRKLDELNDKLTAIENKSQITSQSIKKAKVGKEENDDRANVLQELSAKEREVNFLAKEIEKYKECDPEVMEQMKKETIGAKEAANRWTDNVFSLKTWIKNKFYIEESILNKQFGIPEELDYID